MVSDNYIPNYVFIVDTDKYAGNFERQMCAYMTAYLDEITLPECYDLAEKFEAKYGEGHSITENLEMVPAENDCVPYLSAVDVRRTPSANDAVQSVAIYFFNRPSAEDIQILKERALEYAAKEYPSFVGEIKVTGFRLFKQEIKATEESI